MLVELEKLIQYQNLRVIERFQRDFPDKKEKAFILWKDLLRYLWFCQKLDEEKKTHPDREELKFEPTMQLEMNDIDLMWHCFILFTVDYTQFCQQYFGYYLHHIPNIVVDNPLTPEEFEKELERFISFAYDHVGEETVKSWFAGAL